MKPISFNMITSKPTSYVTPHEIIDIRKEQGWSSTGSKSFSFLVSFRKKNRANHDQSENKWISEKSVIERVGSEQQFYTMVATFKATLESDLNGAPALESYIRKK